MCYLNDYFDPYQNIILLSLKFKIGLSWDWINVNSYSCKNNLNIIFHIMFYSQNQKSINSTQHFLTIIYPYYSNLFLESITVIRSQKITFYKIKFERINCLINLHSILQRITFNFNGIKLIFIFSILFSLSTSRIQLITLIYNKIKSNSIKSFARH